MKDLIYLSSPYSDPHPGRRHLRYQAALMTVAHYLHKGIYLFSPILHNHPISCHKDLGSAREWLDYDYAFLERCSRMWVLRLEGWGDSSGIRKELEFCVNRDIKVSYIDPPFTDKELGQFLDFNRPVRLW